MTKQELEKLVTITKRKNYKSLDGLLVACKNAPNLDEAIRLAGCSVFPDTDTCHRHQCNVGRNKCEIFADSLRANISTIGNCKNFDDLYIIVASCKTDQIGDLTIYDVTQRIGEYMGIEPDKVFLHSGTRDGAKKLFGKRRLKKVMPISEFPNPMHVLTASMIEDMLCIEKWRISEYSDWDKE